MRITCDPSKWQRTLAERGLDMRRAKEVFAGISPAPMTASTTVSPDL
jgi:hypothetical protein